MSAFGDIVVTI